MNTPSAPAATPSSLRTWFDSFARDAGYSLRSLSRAGAFTTAVIVTLALCIGANTAILSTLYALLLKPLPVPDSEQVVEIYNTYPKSGLPRSGASISQLIDYRQNADRIGSVTMWFLWNFNFGEDSDPQRLNGARVSAEFFDIVGRPPLYGRYFTTENCVPSNDQVVVLTQSFWENAFDANPNVIGQTIKLSSAPFTIVGVAPRSAELVDQRVKLFKPYEYRGEGFRAAPAGRMYARLKPGVSPPEALTQLDLLERRYYDQHAAPAVRQYLDQTGYKVGLGRFRDEQARNLKMGLQSLQVAVAFVLLIGCANVANLMLARLNARGTELAVRQALGASRRVLARQLLIEATLLSIVGAAIGTGLAWSSLKIINQYLSRIILEAQPITLDGTILGSTIGITLGVALVIGLAPIWQLLRGPQASLSSSLYGGARGASSARGARSVSAVLVTAQVAIAIVLLVGAGLLIRSFSKVMSVDDGVDADRVFTARMALPPGNRDRNSVYALQDRVIAKLQEIPGVEAATLTPAVIMNPDVTTRPIGPIFFPETTTDAAGGQPMAAILSVTPDFFATMGMKILEGRTFTPADDMRTAPVLIIDRALATRHFPGRSALGERLSLGGRPQNEAGWPRIVGVVETARLNGIEEREPAPFVFASTKQSGYIDAMTVAVRTARPRPDILGLVRAKLREVAPTVPLYMTGTMQWKFEDRLTSRRGIVILLTALAGLAVLLSAVGIYGVLAYDVSQRRREIGIRGALGATRGQVIGLIVKQGLRHAGIGLVLGLGGAFYLSRFLQSLLFDVKPADPLSYIGMTLLFLIIALIASYLPAHRAARVNPVEALRND